jgi:hypothetical protein
MTAIQLRAELFREMNPLLDSEVAMTKVIAFLIASAAISWGAMERLPLTRFVPSTSAA